MTDKFPPHPADTTAVRGSDQHTGPEPSHDTTEKMVQKMVDDDLATREAELAKARSTQVGSIEGQITPNTVKKP